MHQKIKLLIITASTLLVFVFVHSNLSPQAIAQSSPATKLDSEAIRLPNDYKIEPLIGGLSVPTTSIFDGQDILVAESGFLNTAKPRILRIKPDGSVTIIASEGLNSPVTGLLSHSGKIYVSHRTKVSIIENGQLKDIVTDLPSLGDHQNNKIVLGPDGKIYIGQGTTTNSAVVGEDNHIFGWLKDHPDIHEIPCKDITLNGENFISDNPLTATNDKATTGAYKAFGTPGVKDEVIKGNSKCGGSIARFNPDGSGFEVVAWGMRNPFGLAFDTAGQLWSTFHGADVRGSRPINNDPDYLVKVEQDAWYGWPDFFDGQAASSGRFAQAGQPRPKLLWKDHPALAKAYMTFDSHSAANGLSFAPREFGHEGDGFIANFGTFAPLTSGLNIEPTGFSITRVDLKNKKSEIFASNKIPGPAYINRQGGFNRPSDVMFGPDSALYVTDWGAAKLTEKGMELVPGSGAIWRIYPKSLSALRPDGPIVISADLATEKPITPIVPNIAETYKAVLPQWLWLIIPLLLILGLIWWRLNRK